MASRVPLPTQIKEQRGTLRPCRTNKNEPKLGVQIPMPPDWLSERAKEAYQELASVLYDMKVISVADRTALTLLCESYATYRDCYEFIKENGRTYKTYSTYPVRDAEGITVRHEEVEGSVMYRPYPEVAMMNESWKQVRSMLAEMGLTPSSRTKVSPIGEKEEDPLKKLLERLG